ncbi:MAG: TIR domain-containing protein [Cyanobacteria bacterium P01_F01_bin.150]
MVALQNAFISYGRADSKAFAIRLNQRLMDAGLTVWFDADDIPFGIDYQDEIDAGIANSDNFIYVISPHSVNSPYCDKELLLALKYNKRIIPLMHVEEISYQTWQDRHPNGTAEAWHIYKEKGLHSSHVNLNPAVGRINWIFFCEGVHDFDESSQALLNVMALHSDYTRQHTIYLTQALLWEEHQHQASYLLNAEQSVMGRAWLQTQFLESLPPCSPTDLHCEFVTESLKVVNQGMTHVFLSYSEDDRNHQHHLRSAMLRKGFTVWTNTTDIRTGVDFQQAIYEGIEKADVIVFLVSPNSIASPYCQDELAYGGKYNKRIIPVLIQPMDVDTLPQRLQSIQFIEGFQPGQQPSQPTSDQPFPETAIAQLIRALNENSDYYSQHKELLVQALEWDRRDRTDDLVLHGQDFVAAEAWWEISQQTAIQPPPTRLHKAFITASQAQNRFFDAFISYGRADSLAFASRLHKRLLAEGFNVWFDQKDIPVGVDFQDQIDDGIEKSHNFIFIIAPHSIHSPYCLKEIELAIKLNKRIIPLMHVEEINYDTWKQRNPGQLLEKWDEYKAQGKHSSFTGMHPEIQKINWIFFQNPDVFDTSLQQLTTLLHQHESYVRRHTALLTRALDWQRQNGDAELLLTGDERTLATQWLQQEFKDQQAPCYPTVLHGQFITESVKQASNQMTDVFLCYAVRNNANLPQGDIHATELIESYRPNDSEIFHRLARIDAVLDGVETNSTEADAAKIAEAELDTETDRAEPNKTLPEPEGIPSSSAPLPSAVPSHGEHSSVLPHPSIATSRLQYIRHHLIRAGLTVWDYTTDIRSGDAIQTAVKQGIETTDTFIFLLSNVSLQSPRCQQELHHALQLNKRILPIKIEPLRVAEPDVLSNLNVIDLSRIATELWVNDRTYSKSKEYFRPLFQILKQEASYYKTHKRLLAIALKWERQQKNPTVLLRGNTLKQYDDWLQIAMKRRLHPPVEMQTTFVAESKKQPPSLTLDVFIIYAPEDFVFVRTLNDTLQIQNKTTWFDETVLNASIQDLETLNQDVLDEGIDQSENIIFVVSPSSIKNSRCIRELDYAHQRNKRIIPVLYREVFSAQAHSVLAQTSWLDFQPQGNFSTQFGSLFRQLESDPEHIRPHTRLLVRSREWNEADRDKSYLLRGKELQSATDWLAQAQDKNPPPTTLQQEFISESQALPFRKLKKRSVVLTSLLSAGLIFGMRLVGLLLPLELWAYDQVLRLKLDESQDDRFLMVQVDDESGRWLRDEVKEGQYDPWIGTVPDEAMAIAIKNLRELNPSVIGLDFYRDFRSDPETDIEEVLKTTDNLIGLCKAEAEATATEAAAPGYAPPSEVPIERIGFNDFVTSPNNFLRRHLVKNSEDSALCSPEDSFSLLLARNYLEAQGYSYTNPFNAEGYSIQDMEFGDSTIPQLYNKNGSAYSVIQGIAGDRLNGYQIMANFRRHNGDVTQFAPTISLKRVVEGDVTKEEVGDRIVIIGYVDESDRNADFYNTAYDRMPGAIIQGQLASQLISKVMDNRPLIWWWPLPTELLWITGWSVIGGVITWGVVRPGRLLAANLGAVVVLIAGCGIVMITASGWIPLVPPLLAGGITGGIIAIRNRQLRRP